MKNSCGLCTKHYNIREKMGTLDEFNENKNAGKTRPTLQNKKIETKKESYEKINIKDYEYFINGLNEIETDILGNDYTSCWLFAYFIHTKYNLPISNYECVYDQKENIEDINLNQNGIYSYFMSNDTEFHHFILFVNNNEVILKSTYGGQKNIITKIYKKNDFIRKIQDLILNNKTSNKEKKQKYCQLFGIIKAPFKVLDLTNTELSYSFTNS